ncbi:MAG TPA: hypothetical protein VFM95_06215 [Microcella sp.]|nr:hypothetical protein [Microcella sp.]
MKGLARIPADLHRDPEAVALRQSKIAALEDEVFQTSVGVVQAMLDFHLVDPKQQDPPPEWVELYGEEAARQRLAVAKAGWMPNSLKPSGLDVATRIVTGIARARGNRQVTGPAEINVKLSLPAPTSATQPGAPVYPTKEIE